MLSVNRLAAPIRASGARLTRNQYFVPLGEWHSGVVPFDDYTVFAMGAVPKSIDGVVIDEMRPTSDHTASGLNAATDMSFLRHSVTSYRDVARFLRPGYLLDACL